MVEEFNLRMFRYQRIRPMICPHRQSRQSAQQTMQIIDGTVKSTPLQWLPVLTIIPPSSIRREELTGKLVDKILSKPELPLHQNHVHPPLFAYLPAIRCGWTFPKIGPALLTDGIEYGRNMKLKTSP